MNLSTEISDLKMSHYLMLTIFCLMQFVARAIFTTMLLLYLREIGIYRLFQRILKYLNK